MRIWWDLQDAIFDFIRATVGLLRISTAWCHWRRRQFIQVCKSMTMERFFALLSAIATVCATVASGMSYSVSLASQQVADESLAVTKAIDLRNQLQQRAIITVRDASINQYGIQNSPGEESKAVTTVSLSLKNSGHNPVGWIRLRGGALFSESAESRNSMSNDSEQLLVLELGNLNLESRTRLRFGFEYWDEELKKCFYGKVEYKLVRDPKNPKEFVPTPFVSGEADDEIRRLKSDEYCTRFAASTQSQE
ncbi:hypothetical protein GTP45_05745 [Pseudoduganella sp. FT55W]|uniref:Uncharacterized protein n=1 Tax=Duganella rivi TaxID=2666083 RepID=A0A7X4KAK9_9BURK|nr:hypothetical protein [Duganella rivi]MYM66339.1 hypothetical protein [Duganella rivi]